MAVTPIPFEDFSGGQADLYIGTDVTRAANTQNFLIDETKKPYVRYGTNIYPNRVPGAFVPSDIFLGPEPFTHPIVINGPSAYVASETTIWNEIKGVNTSLLPTKGNQSDSGIVWRRQLIAAAPLTGLPPSMIYCQSYVQPATPATPATYTALTLGLPALASSPTIHYSISDAYQTVYAFYYKATFIDYKGTLFEFLGNPSKPAFVNGSAAGDPSSNNIAISNIPVLTNSTLTNYDTTAATTVNTTYVANSFTATVASATGLYIGQQIINANVTQGTVITAISGPTITMSLPAVTPATASSTVFSAITVQIYRTINGGSVFFYTGQIANGVTSFNDAISDATIQLQQPIYTSGNALGYDPPPTNVIALTQTNDTFWYATATTLYQSVSGSPGACPTSFSNQFDQKLVGLSDVISYPILFCDKSVYRIEGTFDSFGNNGWVPREIHKTAGCISQQSIVKIPGGLIWFGNGGIYFTDGYQVTKVSMHLDRSYQVWASSTTKGEYDPVKNMVYWTVKTFPQAALPNNGWVVMHLNYGIAPQSVFTFLNSENNIYPSSLRFSLAQDIQNSDPSISTTATWTSGQATMSVASASGIVAGQLVTAVGVPYGTTVKSVSGGTTITLSANTNEPGSATSVTFSQVIYSQLYSRMCFTDANGYLLWFDPNSLTDVQINTNLYPSQMAKKTIMYEWVTAGLDQGISGFRKYTSNVSLEVDAQTPVAIQIRHRRDDGGGGWSGEGGSPPSGRGIAGSPGGGSSGNPGVPEIRQDGAITWGITDCVWSVDPNEHLWNDFSTVAGNRSVPAAQLRSSRRQLKFCPSFTIIAGSDTYGTATVSGAGTSTPFLTLDNYPSQIWITDPEGYYVTFVSDGYTQTFYILSRVSDSVLQLTDPLGKLVNGSQKWEIKGFRKFERPRILNFTMYAEVDGPTFGQATQPVGANA